MPNLISITHSDTHNDEDTAEMAVEILNRDLRAAATTLSLNEAKFLVKAYYTAQDNRMRASNQVRTMAEVQEPNKVLSWYARQYNVIEQQIKSALDKFSTSHPLGIWQRSIIGIGPVIAAGFIAYTDDANRLYAGQLWRYAGFDPTIEWLGREKSAKLISDIGLTSNRDKITDDHYIKIAARLNRTVESLQRLMNMHLEHKGSDTASRDDLISVLARRPWNNSLKVLCWKAGESIVKTQNHKDSQYGSYFRLWRNQEEVRNEQGLFADQAAKIIDTRNIGKDTDAYAAYSIGKLPRAHLHARARRRVIKLYLSHLNAVNYMLHHNGEPAPRPYTIAVLGHGNYVPIPNLDVIGLSENL